MNRTEFDTCELGWDHPRQLADIEAVFASAGFSMTNNGGGGGFEQFRINIYA